MAVSKFSFIMLIIIGFLAFQIVSLDGFNFEYKTYALIPPQITPPPVIAFNNSTSVLVIWTSVTATPPVSNYTVSISVNGNPAVSVGTGIVGTSFIDSLTGFPAVNVGDTIEYRARAVNADGIGVISALSNPLILVDTDGDEILDDFDNCPLNENNRQANFDGDELGDVCDDDDDNDGILDEIDVCPLQPETINNYQDTDGCSDTIPPSSIIIIKDTTPNNAQNFGFTTTGGLTPINFVLDDDADATLSNTRVFSNVVPGSYTITEGALVGFSLINLSCTDPDNGTTINLTTRTSTIDLDAGELITCTFTNSQRGSITIIEDTNPNGPQNFVYSTTGGLIPANFALDDDTDGTLPSSRVFSNVVPGSFSVTQNSVAGYGLTNLVCTDPDNGSSINFTTRVATIDLDAGESITCTFTNSQRGSITIIEDTNPNGPQNFVYSTTGGLIPANFALDDDTDVVLPSNRIFTNVLPGTFTVTQNSPAGFSFTDISCVDPDNGSSVNLATRVSTIDLDAGESITCTYTNTAN